MQIKFTFLVTFMLFFGQLNAQFVKNNGQVADDNGSIRSDVHFTLESEQSRMFFLSNKIVFALHEISNVENDKSREFTKIGNTEAAKDASLVIKKERVDLEFVGANEHPEIVFENQSKEYQNFYLAHCPKGITNVPVYKKVTYKNVYPNIDLVFSTIDGQTKYDIVLRPGAKLSDLKFKYNGAQSISISENQLVAETSLFPLIEDMPLSFWSENKEKVDIDYLFYVDNTFGFRAKEDLTINKTLVIDPILSWATIFENTATGGSSSIRGNVTTDENGNFFYQLNTYMANMPVANPGAGAYYDATYNPSSGLDVYFAKFDVNRNLVWGTYLGGTGSQSNYYDHGIRTHGNDFYVCGTTNSTDFPTLNQGGGAYFQTSPGTGDKGFLSKFNSTTGAMIHSTYLRCFSQLSMDVASNGSVAVSSFNYTWSTTPTVFARAGAYNQAVHGGNSDIFLYMFDANMVQTWGTFVGGTGSEEPMGLKFDNSDNLFMFNRALNDVVPLVNPGGGAYFDNTYADKYDFWIVKFNTTGSMVWSTLYGGTGLEGLSYSQIEVNSSNEIIITSTTRSTVMTLQNAGSGAYFQTTPVGLLDGYGGTGTCAGFLMRFNNNGVLLHSTYMGENNTENYIQGQAIGNCDKHYLLFQARTFPTTALAGSYNVNNAMPAQYNYMAIELNPNFGINWASYVHADSCYMERMVTDLTTGRLYITGTTRARDFTFLNPGSGAYFDNTFSGTPTSYAWALMDFDIGAAPVLSVAGGGPATICAGQSITLNASGTGTINWWSASSGGTLLHTGTSYTFSPGSTMDVFVESVDGGCASPRVPITVTVNTLDNAAFSYGASNFCSSASDPSPTITGVAGGSFSSLPAGLSINASTGAIDVSASTATSYVITYTTAGACPNSATFNVGIQLPPVGTFQYNGGPFCQSGSASVTFTSGGQAGTFTSTAGLSINSATGAVNLGASTANTYTVTNTIAAGVCPQVVENATITIQQPEDASFNFSGTNFCSNSANITPLITGVSGGTFSALPAGLSINATTGEIDFSASSVNNYTVTYTTNGTCPGSATFNVNLQAAPVGTFQYDNNPYCAIGTAVVTLTGGGQSGTYSSTAGLSINSANGSVDLSASTPNTYTVTNTIPAGSCPQVIETTTITIQLEEDASFNYAATDFCLSNANVTPQITGAIGGTFTVLPSGLSINASTGEIDFSTSTVDDYTITYTTSGACPGVETFDISVLAVPTLPILTEDFATICANESITISISSPQSGVVYNIYYAATGGVLLGTAPMTFAPTGSGSYFVQAVNAGGCVNAGGMVEFKLTVNPLPTITSNGDETICPGENATISVNATGTITWSNGDSGSSIVVSPASSTPYTATVTDANGCENSTAVNVAVIGVGSIDAEDDFATVPFGESVSINVLQNDAGGSIPTVSTNPISGSAVVESNGTITYQPNTGFSGHDQFTYVICSSVCALVCDTANVYITIDGKLIDFVIPEGFTPDGDGTNDVFILPNLALYPNTEVIIFNRWGAKVFESNDYQNDWDGRSQSSLNVGGDELPEGTFYYIINMGGTLEDGISGETFKGYLYLKR